MPTIYLTAKSGEKKAFEGDPSDLAELQKCALEKKEPKEEGRLSDLIPVLPSSRHLRALDPVVKFNVDAGALPEGYDVQHIPTIYLTAKFGEQKAFEGDQRARFSCLCSLGGVGARATSVPAAAGVRGVQGDVDVRAAWVERAA